MFDGASAIAERGSLGASGGSAAVCSETSASVCSVSIGVIASASGIDPSRLDTCERISAAFSVSSSGPKPGIAPGSLKSHWFSAMPMKSRMAGSLVHALRSAARVSSGGTPARRNAMMSVSAAIESMGGRLARSNGSSLVASADNSFAGF